MWHGYFVIEREVAHLGINNWNTLTALFLAMGTHDSPFPMYNNHHRFSLDGNSVIIESLFDPTEVTVQEFKQLLADTFGVDVADIEDVQSVVSYGDYATSVWVFNYPIGGDTRFTVRRFGQGGSWEVSRNECLGYIAANIASWEE